MTESVAFIEKSKCGMWKKTYNLAGLQQMVDVKYKLAPGAQVREEDFGLLFYNMHGPRLYFLASGNLLREEFFQGRIPLQARIDQIHPNSQNLAMCIAGLKKSLKKLAKKGVIIEC